MTARVFVGVPLAAPVEQPLDAAIAPLRDIHTDVVWTRPQGWHVTLAFCGDVDAASERRIGDVVADVASVTCAPVLIPRGIAVWHRRTLVLELADEPAGALATVGAHLQRRLAAAGVPVAQRDVAGHVTLARQRRDPLAVRAAANAAQTAVDVRALASWTPEQLCVWHAELGRGPARYVVDQAVAFASS